MVQHKPEKTQSPQFIVEKYIYNSQNDSVEMHVDPVNGDLVITTKEEIIHVPNKSAEILLSKARISILMWEESSKRKSSFMRSIFL